MNVCIWRIEKISIKEIEISNKCETETKVCSLFIVTMKF